MVDFVQVASTKNWWDFRTGNLVREIMQLSGLCALPPVLWPGGKAGLLELKIIKEVLADCALDRSRVQKLKINFQIGFLLLLANVRFGHALWSARTVDLTLDPSAAAARFQGSSSSSSLSSRWKMQWCVCNACISAASCAIFMIEINTIEPIVVAHFADSFGPIGCRIKIGIFLMEHTFTVTAE